jgi:hypothetical protein
MFSALHIKKIPSHFLLFRSRCLISWQWFVTNSYSDTWVGCVSDDAVLMKGKLEMKPWRNSCYEAHRVLYSALNLQQGSNSHRGILPSLRESTRNETGIFRAGKCPDSSLSHSSALRKEDHSQTNKQTKLSHSLLQCVFTTHSIISTSARALPPSLHDKSPNFTSHNHQFSYKTEWKIAGFEVLVAVL